MRTVVIKLCEEMACDVEDVMKEDRYAKIDEFIRFCIRQYLINRDQIIDEHILSKDGGHWSKVQTQINKLSDEELLTIMTNNVTVEKMERIAQTEILKRVFERFNSNIPATLTE